MRLVGIVLVTLGALLLADVLLSPVMRPLVDPGAPPGGIPINQLSGPAVLLIVGLLLLRKKGTGPGSAGGKR